GLAEAIFVDRFRPVNDMLLEMLGQVGGQRAADLRTLVKLIVFPIAAAVKFDGSSYFAGFIEELLGDVALRRLLDMSHEVMAPTRRAYDRVAAQLRGSTGPRSPPVASACVVIRHVLYLYE